MSNAAARLAGVLADQYHIERELGAGGMATVYVAEDLKHHRRVAIKVLRSNLAQALGAIRFLREESSRDGAGADSNQHWHGSVSWHGSISCWKLQRGRIGYGQSS